MILSSEGRCALGALDAAGVLRRHATPRAANLIQVALVRYLLLFCFALSPALAEPTNVAIVVSGDSAPYLEISSTIETNLGRTGFGKARVLRIDAVAEVNNANTDIVVAVGVNAVQAVVERDLRVPVVSTLIPKSTFEKIARRHAERSEQRLSAVYLDQPIARQLDLIRLLLPEKKRIGAILGPDSENLLALLRAETRARGLEFHSALARTDAELFPALENLLDDIDVLLSVPDSLIATPNTVQNILFAAYRHRVPVIGFSPAYVRAGALAAVHSTPAQLALQVVDVIQHMGPPRRLRPVFQHPNYFSVSVNRHVAHSLEIRIDNEEALAPALGASAKRP